jgi:hypothetical protein
MKLSFDSISPITGNLCVIEEFDDLYGNTKLCIESGYQYCEKYDENFEQVCPQIIKDTKFVDEKGQNWYKLIIVSPNLVLIPTNQSEWKVVGVRKITVDEDITNAEVTLISGDDVYVLDTTTELVFDVFVDALNNFNHIINFKNTND